MKQNISLLDDWFSRRDFLQKGSVTALASSLGMGVFKCGEPPTPKPEFRSILSEKIRWGIIGVGSRGGAHVRFIQEFPDFEITAICDLNEQTIQTTLETTANTPATYTEYQRLLENPDVDAVVIAVPNYFHKEMTIAALQAGKHVLCEKPMAITIPDCAEMIRTWKASGKILMIGTQLRYSGFYQKVNELLEQGIIGDIHYMWQNEFRKDWAKKSDDPEEDKRINWRYFNEKSGGTLIEISIHSLDLLMWFARMKPTRIMGSGGVLNYGARETLDCASLIVEFGDKILMTHGINMFSPKLRNMVLIGTEGMMDIYLAWREIIIRRLGVEKEEVIKPEVQGTFVGNYEMYEEFINCVKEERQPRYSPEDSALAVEVCLLGEQAIRERQTLEIESMLI